MECSEYGMAVYNLGDASKHWFFSYRDIYGSRYDNGNQYGIVQPKRWSGDGRYLYFVPFFYGDGGCAFYYEAQALLRLDLSSGDYVEILSPTEDGFSYNISFSDDDVYLGVIETWQEHPILKLTNLTLQTREEIPLGEQYSGAGNLVWSQDHSQILFSARSGDECGNMTYYLVWMDMTNRSRKVILEGKWTDPYKPIRWVDENHVILAEWFSGKIFSLDLRTGKISP